MEFLDRIFFGNSILDWAIGLGIIIGSFVVVKILYWIFSKIIKKATAKTKNKIDDVLVEKLRTSNSIFCIYCCLLDYNSLFNLSRRLTVKP